jgi:hypothetical protein
MLKRSLSLGLLVAAIGVSGCAATLPRTCPVKIGERLDLTVPLGWTIDDHVSALLQAAGRGGPAQDLFMLEALRLTTDPAAAPLLKSETNVQALAMFQSYLGRLKTLRGQGVCVSEASYVEGLYRDFLKITPSRSEALSRQ